MNVSVIQRTNYGTVRFYPDCAMAHGLARLMKRTTFDVQNLTDMKALGFCIVIKHDEVKL